MIKVLEMAGLAFNFFWGFPPSICYYNRSKDDKLFLVQHHIDNFDYGIKIRTETIVRIGEFLFMVRFLI